MFLSIYPVDFCNVYDDCISDVYRTTSISWYKYHADNLRISMDFGHAATLEATLHASSRQSCCSCSSNLTKINNKISGERWSMWIFPPSEFADIAIRTRNTQTVCTFREHVNCKTKHAIHRQTKNIGKFPVFDPHCSWSTEHSANSWFCRDRSNSDQYSEGCSGSELNQQPNWVKKCSLHALPPEPPRK